MFGSIVETDFWDMDALFMPQFHSARDIHSAYYIKDPKYGKLDDNLAFNIVSENLGDFYEFISLINDHIGRQNPDKQ